MTKLYLYKGPHEIYSLFNQYPFYLDWWKSNRLVNSMPNGILLAQISRILKKFISHALKFRHFSEDSTIDNETEASNLDLFTPEPIEPKSIIKLLSRTTGVL